MRPRANQTTSTLAAATQALAWHDAHPSGISLSSPATSIVAAPDCSPEPLLHSLGSDANRHTVNAKRL